MKAYRVDERATQHGCRRIDEAIIEFILDHFHQQNAIHRPDVVDVGTWLLHNC